MEKKSNAAVTAAEISSILSGFRTSLINAVCTAIFRNGGEDIPIESSYRNECGAKPISVVSRHDGFAVQYLPCTPGRKRVFSRSVFNMALDELVAVAKAIPDGLAQDADVPSVTDRAAGTEPRPVSRSRTRVMEAIINP